MATPLLRTAHLRAIEQRAGAALAPGTLMQRAGEAAAAWIARRFPASHRIVVVCGPGNNGGDGYVCASSLRAAGRDAVCVALAAPASDDARAAAARWQAAGGSTLTDWAGLTPDIGVDALFGIGLARPVDGRALQAARWLSQRPCVALDVPSGLDADTGAWVGGVAGVHAAATVTFLAAKPGLYTGDGVDACGEVIVDSLGVDSGASDGALNAPQAFAPVLQPRLRNTHKGRFGSVVVVGGARGMQGAALLAARAALRLGAGRVYVEALDAAIDVDPVQPELMFRRAAEVDDSAVAVVGCGIGTAQPARERVGAALAAPGPCVIDADALNLIAGDDALRSKLSAPGRVRVLTPHPLEAARLLGGGAAAVQADRVSAARRLAQTTGAIVVLKGAGSVIAGAEHYWINPTGGPALATAGAGDVLAGMVGALLAQGFAPLPATLAAVWLHGCAADDFGADLGLAAGDIAPLAAQALARLRRAAQPGLLDS
jgi:hydroxyethylthiazole kinase-like uncharacterized protein yjeF